MGEGGGSMLSIVVHSYVCILRCLCWWEGGGGEGKRVQACSVVFLEADRSKTSRSWPAMWLDGALPRQTFSDYSWCWLNAYILQGQCSVQLPCVCVCVCVCARTHTHSHLSFICCMYHTAATWAWLQNVCCVGHPAVESAIWTLRSRTPAGRRLCIHVQHSKAMLLCDPVAGACGTTWRMSILDVAINQDRLYRRVNLYAHLSKTIDSPVSDHLQCWNDVNKS